MHGLRGKKLQSFSQAAEKIDCFSASRSSDHDVQMFLFLADESAGVKVIDSVFFFEEEE